MGGQIYLGSFLADGCWVWASVVLCSGCIKILLSEVLGRMWDVDSILHTSSVGWICILNVFYVPLSEPFLLEDIEWMDVLGSSIGGSGKDVWCELHSAYF